jgi:hypothetical protein
VQGQAQVLDGGEAADPEQVLLEGADEALDAAVALGLTDEGGRARDAEEGELALEVVGDELAAVIVTQPQAARDALGEGAEADAHPLAERLERLEPRRRRAAWIPRHSVEPWSTVTKIEACPSPVRVEVRSAPHISSTRSVRMVPSWAFGPCGRPTRRGASRSCSRIKRSTRRLEVRTPAKRRRAQTLRWPSPCAPLFVGPAMGEGLRARPAARPVAAAQGAQIRVFVVVGIAALFGGIIFHGTTVALPKVFEERLAGLIDDIATIGLLVSFVFAIAAIAQIAVGRLLDRYGARLIPPLIVVPQVPLLLLAVELSGWSMLWLAVALMLLVFAAARPAPRGGGDRRPRRGDFRAVQGLAGRDCSQMIR